MKSAAGLHDRNDLLLVVKHQIILGMYLFDVSTIKTNILLRCLFQGSLGNTGSPGLPGMKGEKVCN